MVQRRSGHRVGGVDRIHHAAIPKALGAEQSDFAASENIIHIQRGLTQVPAVLIARQVHMLEAGEQSGLPVADAVHQTEVKLAFALGLVIQILGLGLKSQMLGPNGAK